MSESNSVIKLSESDAIEAGIIASSEFKYVVDEAIITCSNAEIENCPNNLMVDSQSKFYMHSRLVATKADNKPFINIKPFKCPCKYGECRPKFENTWENYVEDITAGGNEPLCEKSILKCTRYEEIGIISIIDTGQRLISDEINEISEMLKNIAQQGGTKQERLQKMTDYLRKKYGNNINVSDFKYENFGKGSILDLTLGEDPIHFINNSDRELLKYLDEYNKEGVFFKKKNRRINPDTGQPKVYEDEIVGNFYTNSAQYKYIKTMSPEIIKKITDGWQMEENEIKKAVSAQSSVIDKLIKAPHTEEKIGNDADIELAMGMKDLEIAEKIKNVSVLVQRKLEGIKSIPGIEGVDIVGYKKDKNGNTVLVVRDYRNILNERDKQAIWNEYRKRGIKIENDLLGIYNSKTHAVNVYNGLGGNNYNDKYSDGAIIQMASLATKGLQGYIVTRSLKANGYIKAKKKVVGHYEEKPKLGKNDGTQVVATASIDEENRVAYGVNQSSNQRSRKYNPYDPVSYRDEKQALKNEKLYQGKGRYEKKADGKTWKRVNPKPNIIKWDMHAEIESLEALNENGGLKGKNITIKLEFDKNFDSKSYGHSMCGYCRSDVKNYVKKSGANSIKVYTPDGNFLWEKGMENWVQYK